jgi:hypothetical protein
VLLLLASANAEDGVPRTLDFVEARSIDDAIGTLVHVDAFGGIHTAGEAAAMARPPR